MTTTTSIIGSWWPSFDYDAGYRLCVSAASYRELATMIDEALNAEREACAKIADEEAMSADNMTMEGEETDMTVSCAETAAAIASRIRERKI